MPGLGRIKRADYRDHAYLAAAHLPAVAPGVVRRRWFVPDCWDQGDTPECVAFSSLMYLVAGPVRNTRLGSDYCAEFYRRCQAIDGDPAPHEGTTVRAAMQNLQSDGYLGVLRVGVRYAVGCGMDTARNPLACWERLARFDVLHPRFQEQHVHQIRPVQRDCRRSRAVGVRG
jgi:hypothetical protein